MSTTSSGRYQSRILSFLSQQSLRFRDKMGETWRKAQIVVDWTAQILLYPIYLAFQGTRLVGRQMGQAVRQVVPQLRSAQQALQTVTRPETILSIDTPIHNTLQVAQAFVQGLITQGLITEDATVLAVSLPSPLATVATELTPSEQSSTHLSCLNIQAIASSLATQNLVLVTLENQILDVLSLEQQSYLQRRIIGELAGYWRQQHQLGKVGGRPAFNPFRRLPVLPLPADRPKALPPIRFFYRLMAWMQTSPIAIATNLFQESQLALSPTVAVGEIREHKPFAQLLWRSLPTLPGNQPQLPQSIPAGLVQPQAVQSRSAQPASSSVWVTMEELFGQSTQWQPSPSNVSPQGQPEVPASSSLTSTQPGPLYRTRFSGSRASSTGLASPRSAQPAAIMSTVEESAAPITPTASLHTQESGITPTYIEAEVKLISYVKHPLEQLLEWIDQGMLWLETHFSKLWQWLRDRLTNPNDN